MLIRTIIARRGVDAAAPAQLVQLTRDLEPPATAVQVFDHVADDLVRQGHFGAAAQYRELLIEKYPGQPAARTAALWLLHLMASSEMGACTNGCGAAKIEASNRASALDPTYLAAAQHLAGDVIEAAPELADDPAMLFQQAVTDRLRGADEGAARFLTRLKHGQTDNVWRQRALAETWLRQEDQTQRTATPAPANLIVATEARSRPLLDGRFSELVWQASETVAVPEAPAPTTARFAYDDQYFYVALRSVKLPGVDYAADDRPRPHDGADRSRDHVRLLVDVDRDYATCFELVIDCRGWTGDAVWGDARWNPQWFVAHNASAEAWQIELAVPLSEVLQVPPAAGDAWAIAVSRHVESDQRQGPYQLLLFK